MVAIPEDVKNGLPWRLRSLLAEARDDLLHLDGQVARIDDRLRELARQDPLCQRLQAIEGIGPIGATALSASLGAHSGFTRARQFAASLGLVPREHSSGHQRRLGSITKRGNGYLRYLPVHGARAVVRTTGTKTSARSRWLQDLQARAGHNRTAVALANKNARIVWALFHSPTLSTGARCLSAALPSRRIPRVCNHCTHATRSHRTDQNQRGLRPARRDGPKRGRVVWGCRQQASRHVFTRSGQPRYGCWPRGVSVPRMVCTLSLCSTNSSMATCR